VEIKFELPEDSLGRKFRVVEKGNPGWCEMDYPCKNCQYGVFDVDRFCCKKLPHGWDEFDEFHGENAYPFAKVAEAAKAALGRALDWVADDIEFYDCRGRNS